MKCLTPQQFADYCHAAMDLREKSWSEHNEQYELTLSDACNKTIPRPWNEIIHILLVPGYCDAWDWCDQVSSQVQL